MAEYLRVRTDRLLQCICEDREMTVVQCTSRQVSLLLGGLGETDDGAVVTGQDGGRDGAGEMVTRRKGLPKMQRRRLDCSPRSSMLCLVRAGDDRGGDENGNE
jgi:hypothetical protein